MKNESVTIVIPVKNESKNIERCLRSIFNQNFYGKITVYVVDDSSTDDTLLIAKKFPVTILHNKEGNLLSSKMMGLRKCSTTYFTYTDADIDMPNKNWLEKLIQPLREDKSIIASFTSYVSQESDPAINKYLTLDPIQRDPLFAFLTPTIDQTIVERKKGYSVCEFTPSNIVPQGLCMFRTKELKESFVGKRNRFYELDNLVILVNEGHTRFAYVPSVAVHHVTIKSVKHLIQKRTRNILQFYFTHSDGRYWTWLKPDDKWSFAKLLFWIIYSETIVLPIIVGLYKSVKHKTLLGLYEPIFVWVTTNATIYAFFSSKDGRKFIYSMIFK